MRAMRLIVLAAAMLAVCTPRCMGAEPAALTADEVQRLNVMEQLWAGHIDTAVQAIRQKNVTVAHASITKAVGVVGDMRDLLAQKGFDVGAVDRLIAMERLTESYMNMTEIASYLADSRLAVANVQRVRALFAQTRMKLIEAQMKFHQVPPLQELCKNFRESLEDFEREMDKIVPR